MRLVLLLALALASSMPPFPEALVPEARAAKTPFQGFSLPDLEGSKVTLEAKRGRVVVLYFWASWNQPANVEMMHLQRLYQAHQKAGLTVLAISSDDARSVRRVRPLVRSKGYTFPVLLDTSATLSRREAPGLQLPLVVLLDHEGHEILRRSGYTPGQEEELEAQVQAALKKLPPSAP